MNNTNSINSNNSISTSTLTSNSNNNNQASGMNASKVFTNMIPTIDRSAFRQQPPPMKVKSLFSFQKQKTSPSNTSNLDEKSIHVEINLLLSF